MENKKGVVAETTAGDEEIDNPSEAERLQVKCLRLEHKVKTLKDVSSIRKNLLDLRERESKDLIKKLRAFEDAVQTEREKRHILTTRMAEADAEYRELAEKLSLNVIALDQAKSLYEKRIRTLAVQLDEAAESLQQAALEKEELEKRLDDESTGHEIQMRDMEARSSQAGDAWELEIKMLERGQKELSVELLKVLKENQFLKEEIVQNNANQAFISHENTLLVESLQNLGQELKVSREMNEILSNRMRLLTPVEENSPSQQHGNITSIMLDVNGILEKLDEAEQQEFHQVPEQENCYKSVETRDGGSELVLSVSRTFIKLKDLIVEKKELQNEIHGLKQLTKKLETKVDKESRRLYLVSLELNKTWRLVGKLKAQHGQLHSSKSVQRYELQEKRRLLESLKRDLGASRAKWVKVREKNLASQIEWESIRDEFARRRREDVCQSRESAFFEDSSSATTTSIEEECGDEASGDFLEEDPDNMEQQASVEVTVEGRGSEAAVDFSGEIVDFEDEVEESSDEILESVNLSYEELINRRAHRLLELEEQCHLLKTKLKLSKDRNTELASKLANLHNHYGSENNTSSEDSAMEGDEIGLLETSGDTAYASHSETTRSYTLDEDATEIPFDNEDEDDMVRLPEVLPEPLELVRLSPVLESGQMAPSSESLDNPVNVSEAEPGRFPLKERPQGSETNSSSATPTASAGATDLQGDIPQASSSSRSQQGNRNLSSETEESFAENQNMNENIQTSGKSITSSETVLLGSGERSGDGVAVGLEDVSRLTSLTPQPLNNYSFNPDLDAAVEEFQQIATTTTTINIRKEDAEGPSSSPSSDVNKLSRIIIQQLPKLLDVLKNENAWLKTQVSEGEKGMKATRVELEAQKELILSLRPKIQASLTAEMELRTELDLKQRLIQELTTKIQIATENYEAINQEHVRMAEYVKMKLQESQIQEQRKLVKMRNSKNCATCTKKFTLFKRKVHCSTCGHSFCADCLIQQDSQSQMASNNDREPRKKILFCISCDERKRKLESVAIQHNFKKIQM